MLIRDTWNRFKGLARVRHQEYAYGTREHLEPCPACGARPELWVNHDDDWTPYQVRCGNCDVRGPKCDCGDESAVVNWNQLSVAARVTLAQT